MSSFFTAPAGEKKRKRASANEAPHKRVATGKSTAKPSSAKAPVAKSRPAVPKKAVERDESISGSDIDSDDGDHHIEREDGSEGEEESDHEGETAAEKRLRLAQRYLDKARQEVELEEDEYAFDAEQIDRDLLAERLQEDVAEAKGKVYRQLASKLDFDGAAHTQFRWNSGTVTSVSVCAPYAYTTTKDGYLTKWKLQDLPKNQWPQTTKKKPKKPPAPPKKKPERVCFNRANPTKAKDKTYQGHTNAAILTVKASSDGKFVVTGGADKRMVVHDAETLKPIRAFTQHRDAVTSLAFRRGTNQIFSASKDRTVKVWSLDELAYVETLFGHQDEIPDIDALAGERCVSVGARDRTARYWKVPEESQLVFRGGVSEKKSYKNRDQQVDHDGTMDQVAMIDDELFVTGDSAGTLALWGTSRKKALFTQPCAHGIDPPLKPSEVSADANADESVVPTPQPRAITALRTIPYSDVILSGSWDGFVRVWRLSEDKKKILPVGVLGSSTALQQLDQAEAQKQKEEVKQKAKEEKKKEENESGATASSGEEGQADDEASVDGSQDNKKKKQESGLIRGIINDIAIFERGDRGRDGICIVVATGKEMRLGRWKVMKDGRNGATIFEVPKVARRAGAKGEDSEDEEEA
ncbi:WD40-repeat-containing domain protein [Pseudoneurospora amorphoporcata]|uniref:WD40-repeat-containing domain protein n=1 Tax=Pseudoneurospora amorphoporcata TaxID=241081 RepID=A0AAN6P489_9PEZI|nr:WD40-repeat-containing domain protein [Pseudoneurospora amorphoporcata]